MSKTGAACQGHSPLKWFQSGRIHWLWSSETISTAFQETVGHIFQQVIHRDKAVPVNNQKIVTPAVPETDISAGAGEAFRIFKEPYLWIRCADVNYDVLCAVIGHAVNYYDFKAISRVILVD
jgi:hypothetical protein